MSYKHYIVKSYKGGTVVFFGEHGLIDMTVGDIDIPDDYDPSMFDYLDILPIDCNLVIEEKQRQATIPIAMMGDYDLYNHYKEFDFDIYHPSRYALAHNELVSRFLIDAEYVKLDDYIGSLWRRV